jgi:hypothetical protein
MTKESRVLVRLISLWIILAVSLGAILWSVQNLTLSIAKTVHGGYENYTGLTGGYGNYCLEQPVYPSIGSGMILSPEDKAANEKYIKEQAEYNAKVALACKVDLDKQQAASEQQAKSASVGNIFAYSISLLLSIIFAALAFIAIRKSEKA